MTSSYVSRRPQDWSVIGLDEDPVPGDPEAETRGGRHYQKIAVSIGDAAAAVNGLTLEGFESEAVTALMEKKDQVIDDIRRAQERYRIAGGALVDDGQTLAECQQEAAAALVEASRARVEQAAAERRALQVQDQMVDARQDDVKDELRRQVVQVEGVIEVAAATIAAARARVDEAVATRNASAERAVSQIQEITSSDGLNDSWWDDHGADIVAAVADVMDVVSQVAGVLALVTAFIPGLQVVSAALLAVSAVAGAISMLANLTLAATGEKSWKEVGIAVATSALSVVGLGAAGAAAKVATKALLKPSVFKQVESFACKNVPFGTCFVAGTLIHTPDGPRPIETIRTGDKVWSHNLATGTDELQLVNETFVRTTTTLYHLTIDDDVITTTAEHPFMVDGLGWIEAQFLQAGQQLTTVGDPVPLAAVEIEYRTADSAETVYNFHVNAHYNYYVISDDEPILVHNAKHKTVKELSVGPFKKYSPGVPGDGLTANHMPQQALLRGKINDRNGNPVNIKMRDGLTIVMKHDDHELTRTYKGRGGTPGVDAGKSFQDVLELDIHDIRNIGQKQYNDAAYYDDSVRDLIDQWDRFTDTDGNPLDLVDGAALKAKLGL